MTTNHLQTLYLDAMQDREKIGFSLQGIQPLDMLITAYSSCGDGFSNAIGYCLQIRHGSGEAGSDNQVFLRHADGTVRVHHQQAFYRIAQTQKEAILAQFVILPDQETLADIHHCPNGIAASGFRVALSEDCYQ